MKMFKLKNYLFFIVFTALFIVSLFSGELIFHSGYEPGTSCPRGAGDITGIDNSVLSPNDWVNDLEGHESIENFFINYIGGTILQRYAEIITDPADANNKIMHFWLKEVISSGALSRIQTAMGISGVPLTEFFSRQKMFLHTDILILTNYTDFIDFFMYQEMFMKDWAGDEHPFRLSWLLEKASGTGNQFEWVIRADTYPVYDYEGWRRYNRTVPVPFGKWFTTETYYKMGDNNTGRVIFSIQIEGQDKQVLFDITDYTYNPYDPKPVRDFCPQKLYVGRNEVDYVRNNGGVMQIYYDDWELWDGIPPDGPTPASTPTPTPTPLPTGNIIIESRVITGNNDAEQNTAGGMYLDSSDLELVYDGTTQQLVGLKFNNITLDKGVNINNAYIQFKVDEASSTTANLIIHGEASDNAFAFTSTINNISQRTTTEASANWVPPAWNTVGAAGIDQRTVDISSIIQEIINRSGWTQGNSIVIIITGSGTRTADSYEGSAAGAPLLHIEYSADTPSPTPSPTPVSTTGWVNSSIDSQTSTFTCTFDVTPQVNNLDGVAGLSLGTAATWSNIACIVQFNQNGYIYARNGSTYNKENNIIYSAGTKYTVKFIVDILNNMYSIYVTPEGGAETVIGTDFAFRTDQAGVASLDNHVYFSRYGIIEVNNFQIVLDTGIIVTASGDNGNVPENTLDGDLSTWWSDFGDGKWIEYDLGEDKLVSDISIAWYRGDTRKAFFDVEISSDGINFTQIYTGVSSGITLSLQNYDFTDAACRYIKLIGHGNTENMWFSINEVEINTSDVLPSVTVTASGDNGNIPENTLDKDLSTWWSDFGDGKWIEYDIGILSEVTSLDIAWYKGDVRKAFLEVQVSIDGITYAQMYDGVSSGTTLALQNYDIADTYTRYIKIIGHGNTENEWLSINEVELNATSGPLTIDSFNKETVLKSIKSELKNYFGIKKQLYNISTTENINFGLHLPETVKIDKADIKIFDIKGNLIKKITADNLNHKTVSWDLKDNKNNIVMPGMYIYKLKINTKDEKAQKYGSIILVK